MWRPSDWYSPSESLITPGNPDEIDPRAEVEAADDGRARQDQHRHALEAVDHRMRDRPAAAQVAEAEAVVAVDQDPCVVESFHEVPLSQSPGAPLPGAVRTRHATLTVPRGLHVSSLQTSGLRWRAARRIADNRPCAHRLRSIRSQAVGLRPAASSGCSATSRASSSPSTSRRISSTTRSASSRSTPKTRLLEVLAPVWQSVPGTVVLYGSLIVHALLGLYALWVRKTLRMPTWELAQLVFGLAVPLLLIPHVFGTRVAQALLETNPTYHTRRREHLGEPDGDGPATVARGHRLDPSADRAPLLAAVAQPLPPRAARVLPGRHRRARCSRCSGSGAPASSCGNSRPSARRRSRKATVRAQRPRRCHAKTKRARVRASPRASARHMRSMPGCWPSCCWHAVRGNSSACAAKPIRSVIRMVG